MKKIAIILIAWNFLSGSYVYTQYVHSAAKPLSEYFIFDEKKKQQEVIELVKQGIEFFNTNSLSVVSSTFTHSKKFINGELYLYLLDMDGVILAHGQEEDLIWDNMYNYKGSFGSAVIQAIIDKAKNGGGWVTDEWRNAVKQAYVQKVTKDEKDYVIGCGYYSHSKEDTTVGLVKSAVVMFDSVIAQGHPPSIAFSVLSYPMSKQFVRGDLYLYALGFDGIIRAHGERPGLIGSNSIDYKDAKGKFVNQEIIKKLKETDSGIWITYTSKNALKKAYAHKVTDAQGNNYFIACGYYPDADRDKVVDLVRKGYQFMKASGKSAAVAAFTDKRDDSFRYGDLWLEVYTTKGVCVAHGENEELIGQNLWNKQDEDGRYYVREYVATSKDGHGWVNVKLNNSFMTAYVEKIDLGLNEYVITAGTYPVSKSEVTELLVKSAIGLLETDSLFESCHAFTEKKSNFIRGDLLVFVFDQEGICYAYGDEYDLIWKNMLAEKDDEGKPYVQVMINSAHQGPGYVTFKRNNQLYRAFVEQTKKDGKTYMIGSGFYV